MFSIYQGNKSYLYCTYFVQKYESVCGTSLLWDVICLGKQCIRKQNDQVIGSKPQSKVPAKFVFVNDFRLLPQIHTLTSIHDRLHTTVKWNKQFFPKLIWLWCFILATEINEYKSSFWK